MVTLNDLEQELKTLGPPGPAYSVGYNSMLKSGNPDDPFDIFMFIPFNRWSQVDNKKKNVIADSFKEVIDAGLSGDIGKLCLIDIALLDEPKVDFMHQTGMIEYLAEALQRPKVKDVKTVIRLLVGSSNPSQRRDNFRSDGRLKIFQDIFWPNGKNLITHSDATLIVGYYNPTLRQVYTGMNIAPCIFADPQSASRLLNERPAENSVMGKIERILGPFAVFAPKESTKAASTGAAETAPPPPPQESSSVAGFLASTWAKIKSGFWGLVYGVSLAIQKFSEFLGFMGTLAVQFKSLEAFARTNSLPAMSWNHAKYTAVNGKAMMTGGFNFWDDYIREREITEKKILHDFGIKLQGDTAIAVHDFATEIFGYLATFNQNIDNRSMAWKAKLGDKTPNFEKAEGADALPSYQFNKTPQPPPKGAIKVLSVARVGAMKLDDYRYPAQLLDGFRDILQNAAYHYSLGNPPKNAPGNAVAEMVRNLGRVLDKPPTVPGYVEATAAAWASKHARLYAIANAKSSIHMTAESLVERLKDNDWEGVVAKVNSAFGIPDDTKWDGTLWPYGNYTPLSGSSRLSLFPFVLSCQTHSPARPPLRHGQSAFPLGHPSASPGRHAHRRRHLPRPLEPRRVVRRPRQNLGTQEAPQGSHELHGVAGYSIPPRQDGRKRCQ